MKVYFAVLCLLTLRITVESTGYFWKVNGRVAKSSFPVYRYRVQERISTHALVNPNVTQPFVYLDAFLNMVRDYRSAAAHEWDRTF
jgi:hypothetical protein